MKVGRDWDAPDEYKLNRIGEEETAATNLTNREIELGSRFQLITAGCHGVSRNTLACLHD